MSGIGPEIRYARQIRYARIGQAGQDRLRQAHAAVVGVGALGCVIASHLARAGVGRLTLIDRDVVEASNLQRQLLYDEADAADGTPKAAAAARKLAAANGDVAIEAHVAELNAANADRLLGGAALIVDGTDNFAVRYLINEYAVKHRVPWIYGGAVGASGMTATFRPAAEDGGPCFRCLFPEPPAGGSLDTCETAGVIAPIVDTIASVQAMEAIKLLTGQPEALHRSLLQIDLWHTGWQSLSLAGARRADCPVCGDAGSFPLLESGFGDEPLAAALCGRNAVQISPARPGLLALERLAARWEPLGRVERNEFLLRLHQPSGLTFTLFPDGRALISGTDDFLHARRVYAELLGE